MVQRNEDGPSGRAVWLGSAGEEWAFHAVSGDNANFALHTENLIGFATDPMISILRTVLIIARRARLPRITFAFRGVWCTPAALDRDPTGIPCCWGWGQPWHLIG